MKRRGKIFSHERKMDPFDDVIAMVGSDLSVFDSLYVCTVYNKYCMLRCIVVVGYWSSLERERSRKNTQNSNKVI